MSKSGDFGHIVDYTRLRKFGFYCILLALNG